MVVWWPRIHKLVKILDADRKVQNSLDPFLISSLQALMSFHSKKKGVRTSKYLNNEDNRKKEKMHQMREPLTYVATEEPYPKLRQKRFPILSYRQRST